MKPQMLALAVLLIGSSQNVMAQAQSSKPAAICEKLKDDCKAIWAKAHKSQDINDLNKCHDVCVKAKETCLPSMKEYAATAGVYRLSCKNSLKKLGATKSNQ
jgi:hypothetical protein